MTHRSRAFTLIELLVVISIIALLVAILLPSLAHARIAAQKTRAMSNARQVQISLTAYAYDNKGSLPYYRVPVALDTNQPFWAGTLMHGQYVQDFRIFWGPGRDTSLLNLTNSTAWTNVAWRYTGFTLNSNASTAAVTKDLPWIMDTQAKISPGQFAALVDFWYSANGTGNIAPSDKYMAGNEFSDAWSNDQGTKYYNLFTYDKALVRTYFDGHGSGGRSEELGWKATTQYLGDWTYTSILQPRNKAPWYARWNKY